MTNIKLVLLICISFFALELSAQKKAGKSVIKPAPTAKDKLLQTDKDFCKMSLKSGMKAAFLHYGDKDLIKMEGGNAPIFGLEALRSKMKDDKAKPSNLIWTPVKAEVAKFGDLGYTFGNWQIGIKTPAGKDSTLYGNYVTIWKKQKDGRWKYVLDAGTDGPGPKE